MSTIRVVNLQHTDATEPNIVLQSDGTSVFASGITISGATTLTVSGTAEFASGTATAPKITFIDDNNTGIYEPAADTVAITTAATERLRIDSSGRLLVGTTSAQTIGNSQAQLEVSTDSSTGYALSLSRSVADIYGPQINFRSTRGTAASPVIVNDNDHLGSIAFYGYDGTDSNHQHASIAAHVDGTPGANDCPGRLVLSTTADGASSPTERLRIDNSGNVGLGLTSPQTRLHCSGTTNGAQATFGTSSSGLKISTFQKTNNDAGVILDAQQASNGTLTFATGGSEAARIDSSGRLIVGRTSSVTSGSAADSIVQIVGKSGSPTDLGQLTIARGNSASNLTTGAEVGEIIFSDNAGGKFAQIQCNTDGTTGGVNGNPGRLTFYTEQQGSDSGPVERMRIDNSGDVGINVTSPVARLDVSGNQTTNVVAMAALDVDCSAGNYFTKTINANSTFTFSNVPASRSYSFVLELTHTSGTVTWPSSVKFPADTAPTLTTGKTHLFVFETNDGGTRFRGASLVDYVN